MVSTPSIIYHSVLYVDETLWQFVDGQKDCLTSVHLLKYIDKNTYGMKYVNLIFNSIKLSLNLICLRPLLNWSPLEEVYKEYGLKS